MSLPTLCLRMDPSASCRILSCYCVIRCGTWALYIHLVLENVIREPLAALIATFGVCDSTLALLLKSRTVRGRHAYTQWQLASSYILCLGHKMVSAHNMQSFEYSP